MNTSTVKILIAYLCACLVAFISCEMEPDPANTPNNGTSGSNNAADNFAPDELSGFLVLKDASKTTGDLPEAHDFQLKINVKDTIYVMKGLYGARVVVRHNGLHDISGFYIAVASSSFYYDVPVADAEAQDSTDVFYVDIDPPEDADVDYPFTIHIKIQPHGPNGEPLDEFDRMITMEDPEADTGCSITVPFTANPTNFGYGAWKWMQTIGIDDATFEVFHREAPGLKQGSPYTTGGCCNNDGTSSTVADDPYCFENFSDGTLNPRWRSIEVSHYFTWVYDLLWFYDNGTFTQQNLSHQTNYLPSMSDFCNGKPFYEFDKNFFLKSGTHDFMAGTEYLTITYDVTDPPVYGKTIRSGEIIYGCGALYFIYEIEGQTWILEFWKADPDNFYVSEGVVIETKDWD